MIKLARATDGRLIILSNQDFPAEISRVEYYRDQRLIMLNYKDNEAEDADLMPCEVNSEFDEIIRQSPEVLIIAMAKDGCPPMGYETPLVQVGL
ncbi:MAG: hypothetical protein AAF244_05010 [Pseudomonadota bacterium]